MPNEYRNKRMEDITEQGMLLYDTIGTKDMDDMRGFRGQYISIYKTIADLIMPIKPQDVKLNEDDILIGITVGLLIAKFGLKE